MSGLQIEYIDPNTNETKRIPIWIVEDMDINWQYGLSHHPIEAGEDTFDHHSIKPVEVKFNAVIPNTTTVYETPDTSSYASKYSNGKLVTGVNNGGQLVYKSKEDILTELVNVANNGIITKLLVSGEGIWKNFMLDNFSLNRGVQGHNCYKIPLSFKHIVVAKVEKTTLPAEILQALLAKEQQIENAKAGVQDLSNLTNEEILVRAGLATPAQLASYRASLDPLAIKNALGNKDIFGSNSNVDLKSKTIDGYSITSLYGELRDNRYHKGIDIGTPVGTPLYAPFSGVVSYAYNAGGWGKYAIVTNGTTSYLFGHLSSVSNFTNGSIIKAGQYLGKTGGDPHNPWSGSSTGAHLHLEVMSGGEHKNPLNYVAPKAMLNLLKN